MRPLLLALAGAAAIATTLAAPRAEACGGCFNPPETPTVVTDHRMIFSISTTQSTLYDQIEYSGAPADFAWVLPYFGDPLAGDIVVGVSSDILFSALDQLTQTRIVPPPVSCPSQGAGFSSSGSGGASASGGSGANEGVTVVKREVVGPYDLAYLAATNPDDPKALQAWLKANKYIVPPDVAPVIAQYQAEGAQFLAVKLVPGQGVQDMRPIRVTTKGANVALPLRMVAAGTGPTVGISLWVVADGRYEPQNFGAFTITNDELEWDWAQSKSNYTELRAAKTAAGGGKTWEVESSTILYPQNVEAIVKQGSTPTDGAPYPQTDDERAAVDYLPATSPAQTARQVRDGDLTTLFYGIATATTRVTRLRADLAHAALSTDLTLRASSSQDVLPNVRQVTRSKGQPTCPGGGFPAGTTSGTPGTSGTSGAPVSTSASTFTCAAGRSVDHAWLLVAGGFGAIAIASRARRRKDR